MQETTDPSAPQGGRIQTAIACAALAAILGHLLWRWSVPAPTEGEFRPADLPLLAVLALGGGWLVLGLLLRVSRGEFGSDLLAGISIVASAMLDQYLAGAVVVLMLS